MVPVIAAPEILEHVPESASPSVDDVPAGVNPEELARALEILEAANALPPEHPDKVALQRATAKLYKTVKKQRRDEAKSAIQEADRAVIESTATGAPTRIDDETAGVDIRPGTATGPFAGRLSKPQGCRSATAWR